MPDGSPTHVVYTLLPAAQAILVPDSSSAARWGALDDVVMVSGREGEDIGRH